MINATYTVIPEKHTMKVETETLDPAQTPPGHILVEAETTVISAGTEIAGYTALDQGVYQPGSYNAYPWRSGYGLVGRVLATGDGVTKVSEGERVFCNATHSSHQFYDVSPEREPYHSAYKIADGLPAEPLALARMALVAMTAPLMANYQAGDTVAVFGLGVVGNIAAQLFKIGGARVIGLDPLPQRCDYARKVGLDAVLDVAPDEQLQAINDLTGGEGARITIDAAGHSAVTQTAVYACAHFGEAIILGSPRAPHEADITPLLSRIHHRFMSLRGALEWQNPSMPVHGGKHSIRSKLDTLLWYLQTGKLDLETITSHVIKPAQIPETYAGLAANPADYMGVVVDWRE